jgi:hypothetical protein
VAHRGRASADERLAAELAAGKTVREAAPAAGVSERTAFRRLADTAFKARVDELRAEMVSRAAGRLADGMVEAADVLRAFLVCSEPHLRQKAAVKLLELGLKVNEVTVLKSRVARLEQVPTEITVHTDSTEHLSFQDLKQIARQAIAEMRGGHDGQSRGPNIEVQPGVSGAGR